MRHQDDAATNIMATTQMQARQTATPLVSIEGLHKRRSQGDSSFVLDVPTLHIRPGEVVAIVGDSGCGKSTLLDLLALVMQPTRVSTFTMHPDITTEVDVAALWAMHQETRLAWLRCQSLGYILQTGGLLPFLNVYANAALSARIKGLQESDYANRLHELATRLGVANCLPRMPDSLSLGQRQRIAILRALVHNPDIILADEPTASVDKTRARSIMQDLNALAREQGVAVVIVTHDVDLVAPFADITYGFEVREISTQESHAIMAAPGTA